MIDRTPGRGTDVTSLSQPATIPMMELFHSYQGEGPKTGRLSTFVRVAGCNLACKFCDTKASWKIPENGLTVMPEELADMMKEAKTNNLVVTGGEPLLYQSALRDYLADLETWSYRKNFMYNTEVETNGSLIPEDELTHFVDNFNVSIKLSNSGMETQKRIVPDAINQFVTLVNRFHNIAFKFVVGSFEDIAEVDDLVFTYKIPKESVWLMPLGTSDVEVINRAKSLTPLAQVRGYNVSLRTHILVGVQ